MILTTFGVPEKKNVLPKTFFTKPLGKMVFERPKSRGVLSPDTIIDPLRTNLGISAREFMEMGKTKNKNPIWQWKTLGISKNRVEAKKRIGNTKA